MNLKCYRYMWLFKDSEALNLKVVTGVQEEHDTLMQRLKDDERVVSACRVYMHEVDPNLVEEYESIKEKNKDVNLGVVPDTIVEYEMSKVKDKEVNDNE